jgi:AcrR family transcriptional regulator
VTAGAEGVTAEQTDQTEQADQPQRPVRSARAEQIVTAARELLERDGPEALTMRALAAALGMQAPSLYKHFASKGAVELAVISDALWETGLVTHAAARGGPGALAAAYRSEARRQPNLYRLATSGPLDRPALPPGLEDWAGSPWYLVTGDPVVAQAFWSFAHGMVILELDDRYPPGSDLDATWAAGVHAFTAPHAGVSTTPGDIPATC